MLIKAGGPLKLYRIVLERFISPEGDHRNRVVRRLTKITNICIEDNFKEFENEMSEFDGSKKPVQVLVSNGCNTICPCCN